MTKSLVELANVEKILTQKPCHDKTLFEIIYGKIGIFIVIFNKATEILFSIFP